MTTQDSLAEFNSVLEDWSKRNTSSENVAPLLVRMAELFEKETEAYYKMDPDPFDDRHPGRSNPTCTLGHLMKAMFKNEDFMTKLVGEYVTGSRESQREISTAACRVLLNALPGLETQIVFQETEGLVRKLYQWAESGEEPLRSYATGLLAGAMEVQDLATTFKDQNTTLVPLMLKRLHELRSQQLVEEGKDGQQGREPHSFAGLLNKHPPHSPAATSSVPEAGELDKSREENGTEEVGSEGRLKRPLPSDAADSSPAKRAKGAHTPIVAEGELSNSSWAEVEPFVIGSYSLMPLSTTMKQRLILQYLTLMGEYQELMSAAFEFNAMELVFSYIDLKKNRDIRLAFEALKYLATLLCHKKFSQEFLVQDGVQRLLQVYRPSIAATGVSLCLYYLSYFEDTLERVCLLPQHVLSDLVGYSLWLLECSHNSSRCHAAMFFINVFPFKVMLDLFDQRDGLRRLFNIISTLPILREDSEPDLGEDQMFMMRQSARHVCMGLKRYFEAHLLLKCHEIQRSHARNGETLHIQETPAYKPLKLTGDSVQESLELLTELLPVRAHWTPVVNFMRLGGVQLLVQLVARAPAWNNYPGKGETIRSALEALYVCTASPGAQLQLLNQVPLTDNQHSAAISVLISLAEGEVLPEVDVQRSALEVICNCVCGPVEKMGGGVGRYMGGGTKKKINLRTGEEVLRAMWEGVRSNNGIMVLLKLLAVKTPITEADALRALACRALAGLSRSENVRQIVSKLPLFQDSQLQMLTKEPVLQDKRKEHIRFCKYASELAERVSGKQSNTFDATLEDIRRADIVAQTKITFFQKELLQLIHDHLMAKGFTDSASALQLEANLPTSTAPPTTPTPGPAIVFSSPRQFQGRQLIQAQQTPSTPSNGASVSAAAPQTSSPIISSTHGPIRFTLNRPVNGTPHPLTRGTQKNKFFRETEHSRSQVLRMKASSRQTEYTASLDNIVTEYLRKQHALCRNPVVTCPPMSLFTPHRCPEPKGWNTAPLSITARLTNRATIPSFGGLDGAALNRKYIYSRFRPIRTYRDGGDDGVACCGFAADDKNFLLGTFSGDLKMFNGISGEEIGTYECYNSPLIHLEAARDGKLVLTSTWGAQNNVSLWKMAAELDLKFSVDAHCAEFSKLTQDRIIATKDETAFICDVSTGQQIVTLYDEKMCNGYKTNVATFHPLDELVLNDGVLWDLRTPLRPIHKFDKFNQCISGIFHPMGLEIIINSEVWDIRTFKLLHTVPALDQCAIKFNHGGDVIYATRIDEETDVADSFKSPFGSTLRTFDAVNYSSIGTMDLKTKSIFDLSTDRSDSYLAIVESQKSVDLTTEESVCRLYEIGKLRDEDDEQEEEEDEEVAEEEEEEEDENMSIIFDSHDDDGDFDLDDANEDAEILSLPDDAEEEDNEEDPDADVNDDESDHDDEDDDDSNGDIDDLLFELV